MPHRVQMLFLLKTIRHDGRQPPATCTPHQAVIHHLPPYSWRWSSSREPMTPTAAPPDRCCPWVSCWGFEALISSPLAFLHKNTSSRKLEDEEVRNGSFPRSVLISPHCSCFYWVVRTDCPLQTRYNKLHLPRMRHGGF